MPTKITSGTAPLRPWVKARQAPAPYPAGPAAHRLADGRRGIRRPGRAFHRPHGRDLRSRGAGRSKRADGASQTTVEEQADDLHRLIDALGAGPADIFASSGGAVNALALVARHPE